MRPRETATNVETEQVVMKSLEKAAPQVLSAKKTPEQIDLSYDQQRIPVGAKANVLYNKRKEWVGRSRNENVSSTSDGQNSSQLRAPTKAMKRTQKKVRFLSNLDGTVVAEAAQWGDNPNRVLTEEDVERLWFTARECRDIELQADELTNYFLATTGRYHAAMEQVLTSCLERTYNNLSFQLDRAHSEQPPHRTMFTPSEALRLVVDPHVRGLEYYTVEALDLESCRLFRTYRDVCVSRVLDCQGIWRNDESLTQDQKATLLAQQERQYSGVSVLFARLLADGDAMNALDDRLGSTRACFIQEEKEEPWLHSPTTVFDFSVPLSAGLKSDIVSTKVLGNYSLSPTVATR